MPLVAVTVALTTSVRVWPIVRLVVPAVVLWPMVTAARSPLVTALPLTRLKPALNMSVMVTFSAVLGPRLTSVTV